jgi:hypothetical protein
MYLKSCGRKFALSISLLGAIPAMAATPTPTESVSHLGPIVSAYVQRGSDKLPIFLVDHLKKGDKLIVSTDKDKKSEVQWVLVLTTVSPTGNKVISKEFDLTEPESKNATIDITADDQVPVIVVAPQVRTLFGLHTSFSESASLIGEAIKADPQRFIDLQKIDQINQAVALLAAELDAMIQPKNRGRRSKPPKRWRQSLACTTSTRPALRIMASIRAASPSTSSLAQI